MSPVKGSDLAEQIEIARRSIESWPQWFKDASGIAPKEPVESESQQVARCYYPRLSDSDFIG